MPGFQGDGEFLFSGFGLNGGILSQWVGRKGTRDM